MPGHCGMGFWTNADGRYSKLPKDTYYGAGAGDQLLIVVPSLHLIVVRNGETLAPEPKEARDVFEAFHDRRVKVLFEPVIDAITDRPKQAGAAPYPTSKAITGRAGARDGWVYVYSHDAGSAYQPADRMVLARVPKGRITESTAYEFFKGLDDKRRPLWSKEVADRGAVFTHKGRCYRSGITFNAGL